MDYEALGISISEKRRVKERARQRVRYAQKVRVQRTVSNCLQCVDPIPETKNTHARYCSHKCQRTAMARRRNQKTSRGMAVLVVEFLGGKCSVVDCDVTDNLHVDHIQPINKGGKHEISNVQLLCKPHHSEKTSKESKKSLK